MSHSLFLLKSGQAKQFFQQNITFLAQPEGYAITTRYKQRWVHHALDEPLPQHVVIVYAEPPYQHVLPVREAMLDKYEVDEADESVLYSLTLGPLLFPARLEESEHFFLAHRPDDSTFAFTAPTPLLPRIGLSPERRWQALVQHLCSPAFAASDNPYAHALFLFAHPLASAEGQPLDGQQALWIGHAYQQAISLLAPGLPDETLREVPLHLDYPRLTGLVTPYGNPAEGEITLLIQPLRTLPTPWTVSASFRSPAVPSGPLHLTLPPIVALPAEAPAVRAERAPFQRLQLYEWLATRLSTRDQLRLLDRYLLPHPDGAPPDAQLLLARALLLQKEGQMAEAVDTLMQIADAEQTDEMVVLLLECAVAAGRQLRFASLLDQLTDWDEGKRVQRIVRAIASLPEEQMLPLAYHVCSLAPNYATLVWQEIGPALHQPRHRLALAQFLQGEQPTQPRGYLRLTTNELYHYLARGADPERVSDEHLDYLIEAGVASTSPSNFAAFFLEWISRHLRHGERGEVERVQERFAQVSDWLSTAQEESGVTMLMDALKRVGLAEKAVWLALERVGEAQRASDFERAERWLREARNAISSMPPESRSAMINLIKDEDEHIKQARHDLAASFAPRYGSDPGLAPILKLYGIECVDAFWADLAEVMSTNEFVVRQLMERLGQLQQFAQQSGSSNATIHGLSALQGNVSRMELTDSARLIFKKIGRTIRLIALYPNHDAYDEAIKQRWELMNRIQRG